MIAYGIVDDAGVLNAETLGKAARLIRGLESVEGVVPEGIVSFMVATDVPEGNLTDDDVDRITTAVEESPVLAGKVFSPDGRALAVYVPLESKEDANGVSSAIRALIVTTGLEGAREHYLGGLPLAEEAFGRDMFIQMGILAPIAGLVIFILMIYFFRRLTLVLAAMILAMISVIWTMGLLIGSGFTLHIMSSMIPVFLMPIAILDSIHVLSEFFDLYPKYRDRQATLRATYDELFTPITYTTLTTAVAFAFLALAPIPPVQVFGLFVAFGVVVACLLTMLFIPAYVMLLSEEGLARGLAGSIEGGNRVLTVGIRRLGRIATARPLLTLLVFIVLAAVAIPGLLQININDNPVRWFKSGSEIRVAVEELTDRFPGTFNTTWLIEADEPGALTDPEVADTVAALQEFWGGIDVIGQATSYVDLIPRAGSQGALPDSQDEIEGFLEEAASSAQGNFVGGLITADYSKAAVQFLLKEEDNQSMKAVVERTEEFLADEPLPSGISAAWAGETYLNLVWQDKMVTGMLTAFMSTFGVILVLAVLLFRSVRWAILAMVPLAVTILLLYGGLGFIGKDYDMPLAVLSTLALGIAIDFAIHFIQRYRDLLSETGASRAALVRMFEEPARAISRNAIIIAAGFTPMFFTSLVPYIVVGALMAVIMIASWLVSLILLPTMITLFQRDKVAAPEALD